MEIERKFLCKGLPLESKSFVTPFKADIYQSYIHAGDIESRIRKRIDHIGEDKSEERITHKLTFKNSGDLAREEVEVFIDEREYSDLLRLTRGKPIHKKYTGFLMDGIFVEHSIVDNKWEYIEVEFESEEDANNFIPPDWFGKEITNDKSYKMKNYWKRTRGE